MTQEDTTIYIDSNQEAAELEEDLVFTIGTALSQFLNGSEGVYNELADDFNKLADDYVALLDVANNFALILRIIEIGQGDPSLGLPIETWQEGLSDDAEDFLYSDQSEAILAQGLDGWGDFLDEEAGVDITAAGVFVIDGDGEAIDGRQFLAAFLEAFDAAR